MDSIETLRAFDQIKLLADSRRMEILRVLMASPATLTHLARTLHQSPAWVRHHMLALQSVGLVEMAEVRTRGKITAKFYRAKAGAFLLQELILPTKGEKPTVIFSGSHDLALEVASAHLGKHFHLLALLVGSLDGLVNLRQGLCQISGAHLHDESGEYNTPYVRCFFPDRKVEIITLAYRTQGLLLASGNPKGIKKIADVARILSRCQLIEAAVADRDGGIGFHVGETPHGGPANWYGQKIGGPTNVRAVSLNTLLSPLDKVDLID